MAGGFIQTCWLPICEFSVSKRTAYYRDRLLMDMVLMELRMLDMRALKFDFGAKRVDRFVSPCELVDGSFLFFTGSAISLTTSRKLPTMWPLGSMTSSESLFIV